MANRIFKGIFAVACLLALTSCRAGDADGTGLNPDLRTTGGIAIPVDDGGQPASPPSGNSPPADAGRSDSSASDIAPPDVQVPSDSGPVNPPPADAGAADAAPTDTGPQPPAKAWKILAMETFDNGFGDGFRLVQSLAADSGELLATGARGFAIHKTSFAPPEPVRLTLSVPTRGSAGEECGLMLAENDALDSSLRMGLRFTGDATILMAGRDRKEAPEMVEKSIKIFKFPLEMAMEREGDIVTVVVRDDTQYEAARISFAVPALGGRGSPAIYIFSTEKRLARLDNLAIATLQSSEK
ncbi:MAG: hypothetical protein GMKNLPBB_01650 [Myxococcota bacterium]|nr:hypothetical protein [Myxococcota bacterium]